MKLSHFDEAGGARMVDVTLKEDTKRIATAEGIIRMQPETLALVKAGRVEKGDVLGVARVAGIMAAKHTAAIIPMCHPLLLTGIDISFTLNDKANCVEITATVTTTGKTGVEMEALTAVTATALTIYDMCKAADKAMTIEAVRLAYKSGGKSGIYVREGF